MENKKLTYAEAGVDINRQDEALARIKPLVKATRTPLVRSDIGLFGGLFSAQFPEKKPILVASMDGVGTKLKVARLAGRWNGIGSDLVNHCINDVLVQGARPLFFLDYIAAQRLEPLVIEQIMEGMSSACQEAGCALIGGELAEMPGVYEPGEVDVAGTLVGIVEEDALLPRLPDMHAGDRLIGLKSSGLHTNGYSLARKICFELDGLSVDQTIPGTNTSVGDALLAVHRSYFQSLWPILQEKYILGLAHITGGGLTDNLPRVLSPHLDAHIWTDSWTIPPLFQYLMDRSGLPLDDARRSFNLGVGMVAIVNRDKESYLLSQLHQQGEEAWVLGELAPGRGRVQFF